VNARRPSQCRSTRKQFHRSQLTCDSEGMSAEKLKIYLPWTQDKTTWVQRMGEQSAWLDCNQIKSHTKVKKKKNSLALLQFLDDQLVPRFSRTKRSDRWESHHRHAVFRRLRHTLEGLCRRQCGGRTEVMREIWNVNVLTNTLIR
jgi:hypothetical protein